MADITFPTARILHGEVSANAQPNVLRTEMEAGPAKVAPKQSKSTINYTIPVIFTASEFASFTSTWWPATSKYGALKFNINFGLGTVEARSVSGTFQAQPINPKQSHFRVTLDVEVTL